MPAETGVAGPLLPARDLTELAPAKVNLTLEILGRRADGFHELESLVLFADFGDRVTYRPGRVDRLAVDGPFAAELADGGDNLIARAGTAYARAFEMRPEGGFRLEKRLPVAAGLGGGSADAAATLRLLRQVHGAPEDLAALVPLARDLGADIPCCLFSRAAVMRGVGEQLHPLAGLAPIPALLVNPRVQLATREVFRALGADPLGPSPPPFTAPRLGGLDDVVTYAQARANDLEPPAIKLQPVIADVLAVLGAADGALLSRLSGSGPTCFALFATSASAEAAAERIARLHPEWWVQPVVLA